MCQIFIFGTLLDDDLLSVVLGHKIGLQHAQNAELLGYKRHAVKDQAFPILQPNAKGAVIGTVLSDLSPTDIKRLEYYEAAFGYELFSAQCRRDGVVDDVQVFLSETADWQPQGTWSLKDWLKVDRGVSALAAEEVMSYYPDLPAAEIGKHFAGIRIRAQSRLYAQKTHAGDLHSERGASDVITNKLKRPYLGFFALEERDLTFRKFNGKHSAPVRRATFLLADAVTVLPYDAKRDLVMLIEQFRAGPMGRGDINPWCLEPIAGRVDIGETYSETARREAREEANIDLVELEQISRYYSSPGAVSEFLVSYIGITDLDPAMEGIHGVESETEDIRSLIISFDQLMNAVDTGEIDTGPLLVSALWLHRHRARLRDVYGQ